MNLLEYLKVIRKTFLTPLKARRSYSQCAEDLIAEQFLLASDLQDELKSLLSEYDLKIGKVLKRPIEGLVAYHKNYMMV